MPRLAGAGAAPPALGAAPGTEFVSRKRPSLRRGRGVCLAEMALTPARSGSRCPIGMYATRPPGGGVAFLVGFNLFAKLATQLYDSLGHARTEVQRACTTHRCWRIQSLWPSRYAGVCE